MPSFLEVLHFMENRHLYTEEELTLSFKTLKMPKPVPSAPQDHRTPD